jgi:MOSC domain-containing protein YiiM
MILRRSDTVLCMRSLVIRDPRGYARVIQEGEHVRRGDPITRRHRAHFGRRRWWRP